MKWLPLVLLLFPQQPAQERYTFPKPPGEKDWVVIDGSKEPEKIALWDVWQHALRIMLTSESDPLPAQIVAISSPAEQKFIRSTVRAFVTGPLAAKDAAVMKLVPEVQAFRLACERQEDTCTKENAERLAERGKPAREASMAYRRAAVDTRQKLVEGLSPEAALALETWVKARSAGRTIHTTKDEFKTYYDLY